MNNTIEKHEAQCVGKPDSEKEQHFGPCYFGVHRDIFRLTFSPVGPAGPGGPKGPGRPCKLTGHRYTEERHVQKFPRLKK